MESFYARLRSGSWHDSKKRVVMWKAHPFAESGSFAESNGERMGYPQVDSIHLPRKRKSDDGIAERGIALTRVAAKAVGDEFAAIDHVGNRGSRSTAGAGNGQSVKGPEHVSGGCIDGVEQAVGFPKESHVAGDRKA